MPKKTKKISKYNKLSATITLNLVNQSKFNIFKNDIYTISGKLRHLYENIKLKIEHYDETLKKTIPSFYKCFLICVKNITSTLNNSALLNEIKHITDFLKKNTKYSLNYDINNIKLTQKQLTRLNNIVEDYCPLLERLFNPNEKKYGIPEEHRFLYNIYMSFQGFEQLRNQMVHKLKVYYSYNNTNNNNNGDNNINSHYIIYIKKEDKKLSKFNSILSPLLKQIAVRILFYNVWLSTDRIPDFIIYYSNLKKINETPKNDKTLRSYNVNTAATDTINKIIIWRKEELLKSIFHECNHFHRIDTILNNNMEYFNKYLFKTLHIDKKSYNIIELRESYTEVIANFLNIIALLTISKPHQSSSLLNKNVLKYLNKEIIFSIEQVGKILKHFNFKTANDFLKIHNKNDNINNIDNINSISNSENDGSSLNYRIKPKLTQTTHVISYYIIKSVLLFNLSQLLYLNTIVNNNENNDNNISNEKEMRKLNLILEESGKNEIIKIVKKNFVKDSKWILLVNKNMKKTIKNKTMKMTYYDSS
jgi:hypothetical protein